MTFLDVKAWQHGNLVFAYSLDGERENVRVVKLKGNPTLFATAEGKPADCSFEQVKSAAFIEILVYWAEVFRIT